MLVPNRFSNLKFSLVNVVSLVIDYLMQEESAKIEDLVLHLRNFSKDFRRDDALLAITFLYSLNRLEYCHVKDEVVLINFMKSQGVVNA